MGAVAASPGQGRDRRLDLFRGLALVFIFIDHIHGNLVAWLTIRNFGFSDATEIFVFISGYSAARAYGRSEDFLFSSARILRRCWQVYVAHILLFVIFTAHVASVASHFDNSMFAEEMNVTGFLRDPETTLLQVLLLRFRPANMDVLPLYILLLLGFPLVLPALKRWPWAVLAASAALWQYTRLFDINLHTYPGPGVWYFDPSAWQFLFVLGAIAALHPAWPRWPLSHGRLLAGPVAAYLLFALLVVMSWRFPPLKALIPHWLERWIYPIDKTALDPLRVIHFLCIAFGAARLIPMDSRLTHAAVLRPLVTCGRHSLEVFCLGIILSLVAQIIVDQTAGRLGTHVAVSIAGIALMAAAAAGLDWYQRKERGTQNAPKAKMEGNP